MENKNLKTTFAVVHGGSKKATKNENLLIIISGTDDVGKSVSAIFYASQDLKKYLVSEPHEIKRGMPFDRLEWRNSKNWDSPAVQLSPEELDRVLLLWKNREKWIAGFIRGDVNVLRDKNNKDLVAMGLKPMPATNTMGDFFTQTGK